MVKKITIIILALFLCSCDISESLYQHREKAYITTNRYEADMKVFVVSYPHEADMILKKTDSRYDCDYKVFISDRYSADLKVYFE